jgi:FkbM family methyltransferase
MAPSQCHARNVRGEMISEDQPKNLSDLLLHKSQLEAAMRALPGDYSTRSTYCELLQQLARASFGSFFAFFPEIKTPLLYRGGSSDVWNILQVYLINWQEQHFNYGEYGFPMPAPRRILDLAAYCGYTAVYFANRFPQVEILCVEPPGSNFDTLVANTAAYPNIHCEPAAVWHERSVVQPAGFLFGDWGTHFAQATAGAGDEGIQAYTISDILRMHDWPQVDFIKCTIQGGQAQVLGGLVRPWLEHVTTVTTKAVAGHWQPGEEETLIAAFSDQEFEKSHHGDLLVIQRRSMARAVTAGRRDPLRLVPPSPEWRPFFLTNVAGDFNFHRFGNAGIQLAANPANEPPAAIVFPLVLDRHRHFVARIGTGPAAFGTAFRVRISSTASGSAVVEAQHVLAAETTFDWNIEFEPLSGPHELLLSTEKVAAEDAGTDATRRSYFLDPRLL